MIIHVTIHTSKIQESIDFYQWLLDAPIIQDFQTPMSGRIVFLGGEGAALELIEAEDAEKITAPDLSIGVPVNNLDDKHAMLESKNIPHSDIVSPMPGVRFAFLEDLNGCQIQLMESKEL